jgi:hypothetical protein
MNDLLRVYPQGPVTPISSTLRKDVETADALLRGGSDTTASVAAVGDTIPLVFGQRVGGNGGVFISPPLVRVGVANVAGQVQFSQAAVLSDGELPAVSLSDIWQGGDQLSVAGSFATSTAYGSLPSGSFFNWSLSVFQQYDIGWHKLPDQIVSTGLESITSNGGLLRDGTELEITAQSEYATDLDVSVQRIKHEVSYRGVTRFFRGHQKYDKDSIQLPTASQSQARLTSPDSFNRPRDIKVKFKDYLGADKEDYIDVQQTAFTPGSVTTSSVFAKDDRGQLIPIYETVPDALRSTRVLTASWSVRRVAFSNPPTSTVTCSSLFTQQLPEHATEVNVVDQYKVVSKEYRRIPHPLPDSPAFAGSGGSFSGMTVLGVFGQWEAAANKHLRQLSVFIRNGIIVDRLMGGRASSNLFPDLARYLMSKAARIPSLLIDDGSLIAAAQFTSAQGLHFNGVLATPTNLREYLTRVAPLFLLRPTQVGGKFGLRPVLPTNGTALNTGPIAPLCTYDETTIIGGSMAVQYVELGQRKPFCALMVWREQPEDRPGVMRITEVRYSGTAADGPFEQYDLSDFCTSEAHARMVGKYILSQRRHVTHTITFRADPTVAQPTPGDVVRVIQSNTASAGGNLSVNRFYQVERISEDATGLLEITASHFPTDNAGSSLIAADVVGTI